MMKEIVLDNLDFDEFHNQHWFFQLLVFLDNISKDVDVVLETGTYKGAGAFRWWTFFNEVHTVEFSADLYEQASHTYREFDDIYFYNDTSPNFLKDILTHETRKCIIFLDAHGSGGDTSFDDNYGRFGSPLLDELEAIKVSSRKDHIIIIDDCDDLGTLNYPSKDDIRNAILEINPNYQIFLNIPKRLLASRGTGIAFVKDENHDD